MINYIIIFIGLAIIIIFFVILKSTSFPARIKKAEELLEQGDASAALEIVKAILDKKRDYVPARYLKALILIRQNQYLLAITELNSILGLSDLSAFVNEIDIHNHLARLYNETQNYRKEIDEYKEILIFNPEDLIANHRIGHALYKNGDYKRARDHLLKAVVIDPNLADIFLPLGVSCYHVSDYEKSEEYLLHALNAPGDNSEAQYYLGSIYQMKKDYKSAVSMLESARGNRKYFLKCLQHIGEIYFQIEEFDGAIEILEQGLPRLKEKSEESREYRYLLAECYERQNKIKEAIYHWQKIADENPGFRGTKLKLESYREILDNENLTAMFASSLDALQPTIVEMISSLNYTILSKEKLSQNEYQYKAYNIKRIGDPPLLVCFHRTTREITEDNINEFHKRIIVEKCKNGIYIATAGFSLRAKTTAQLKMIEVYDPDYIQKIMEKIKSRKKIK
jgi:tetratricopeptide (TPR) repeat protein